ncbi:N-acetyl sugar amidotransferase, partial [bacterium]|nr:N-acetyl sugar amidotransferase [bacterium]
HCKNYYVRVANEVHSGADGKHCLDKIVAKIKAHGHGKKYDCVTGVSGGVDSTMVVYTLKKLGLRPLVVYLDNGWNTELANEHIKSRLDVLNIDLHTTMVNWEEFKNLATFKSCGMAKEKAPL